MTDSHQCMLEVEGHPDLPIKDAHPLVQMNLVVSLIGDKKYWKRGGATSVTGKLVDVFTLNGKVRRDTMAEITLHAPPPEDEFIRWCDEARK